MAWHKDEQTGQFIHDASVVVNAPVDQCFVYWSNFESFPKLMQHIKSVKKIGDHAWHWEADIAGRHVEWDAEMTDFRPNEIIAWRSTHGLKNAGTIRFTPEGNSSRIEVRLLYDPPYGPIGDLVAQLTTDEGIQHDLQQDLVNFKQAVESGQTEQYRRAA